MKWISVYKCRRCGKFVFNKYTNSRDAVIKDIYDRNNHKEDNYIYHNCEDGSYGMCDFIGWEKKENG